MVVEREFDRWSGRKGETTERAERGGGKKGNKMEQKKREKEKNGDAPTFVCPLLFWTCLFYS